MIAFDASSNGTIATGTSITWAHTCSGSDRILFVLSFDTDGGSSVVTGITYAGTAMTKITGIQVSGDRWITLWYLIAPATGSNDVVISASASVILCGTAQSYTGAKQSGVPDASNTNSGSTVTSLSGSVTTIADNCWTIAILKTQVIKTITADGGTTNRTIQDALWGVDSNAPKTPAGSTSLGGSWTGTTNAAIIIASFAPAPTITGPSILMQLAAQ